MHMHCTSVVATLALAAAASTLAAPPNATDEHSVPAAHSLTTEAVVGDLVRFRQSDPDRQQPRDGEWYNVPAPLGYAVRTVDQEKSSGSGQAMPALYRADADADPRR